MRMVSIPCSYSRYFLIEFWFRKPAPLKYILKLCIDLSKIFFWDLVWQ